MTQINRILFVLLAFSLLVMVSCEKEKEEACIEKTWYLDADGDGFGNSDESQEACEQPFKFVPDNSDFDDTNETAYPGAEEICSDGIDNNGDGETDCLIDLIAGDWTSQFDETYTITISNITNVSANSVYEILAFGNDYVICLNSSVNPNFPSLYSKFVFTDVALDEFYLCTSFFDASSQEFIENSTEPSDASDLTAGCGGFSWTKLTRM